MENTDLTITRVFDAPRELVWKVWTEQKHIEKWWGPKGFTNPICEWVAEKGSKILIHMKGPDNNVYPMNGQFQEITKPEKLVFTSAALDKDGNHMFEILNTVTFAEQGNKTKMTLHFFVTKTTSAAAPHLAGASIGWNQSFDKLVELLNTLNK
jgi:uncharacterized protein YndB with AHSA1/START domain